MKRSKKRPVCIGCGRLMVYNQLCKPCAMEMDRKGLSEQIRAERNEQERQRILTLPDYERPVAIKRVRKS